MWNVYLYCSTSAYYTTIGLLSGPTMYNRTTITRLTTIGLLLGRSMITLPGPNTIGLPPELNDYMTTGA